MRRAPAVVLCSLLVVLPLATAQNPWNNRRKNKDTQAPSDEREVRQGLRLAALREPRARRAPGAGPGRTQGFGGAKGRTQGFGGANRTRLWPARRHLAPLLPTAVTEHVWVGGCCGLGHRTSRLMRMYVYAVSRGRHVVVDWGACVGTPVSNLFTALFDNWNELRAVNKREPALRSPGCPGGTCDNVGAFRAAAGPRGSNVPNEPPNDWQPPGVRVDQKSKPFWMMEWGLAHLHADVFKYSEHFAAHLVKALRPEIRERLDTFIRDEFRVRGRRARVVGVHFRFGNGEKFGRRPANKTQVVLRTAAAVERLSATMGWERVRVLVATDDASALDTLREHTKLDVFSRPQWRPPPGAGIVFSSWRTKELLTEGIKAATEAAHSEVVKDADTCVGAAADMLIDSLLLGYSDALVLPVPSTFTILSKVMAHSRGAPSCVFVGETWREPGLKRTELELTCLRRDRAGRSSDFQLTVPPQGRANALGARFS